MYIALEGIDGSGKSTQALLLAKALQYGLTREPHDLTLSQRKGSPEEVLKAFMADRLNWFQAKGVFNLVSDRSLFTSAAYQSQGGLPWQAIIERHAKAGVPFPDAVLFVDVPVSVALQRVAERKATSCQWERAESLRLARQAYLAMSLHCPSFHYFDGTQVVSTLHQDILEVVNALHGR